MEHPGFFERSGPYPLQIVLERSGARALGDIEAETLISDVRPLDVAGPSDVSFFENAKYLRDFETTKAAACFVGKRFADRAPPGTATLECDQPYRAFAMALILFYPEALRPRTATAEGWDGSRTIHPTAELEEGVRVEPAAVIGAQARVGRGTVVAAGALVGYRVHVGRDGFIGPGAAVTNSLVGDRAIIHAGARIGQDGFGFALGRSGHLKVPQIGRVVIQDDVEIGANTTIDRGTLRDTIIGEGTKIDNLVQIGHNVVIGRHCVIAGQSGISGSTELGDFVMLGGQVGVVGHIKIGDGAQIAGTSNVNRNVPPGAVWGGTPAKPMRMWFRETAILKQLAEEAERKAKEARSDT